MEVPLLQPKTARWKTNIRSCYELIEDVDKFKVRLINCPWAGIVYVYTQLEAGNAVDSTGRIPATFKYLILDESEDFSMDLFKLDIQLQEFERLLGSILREILYDLACKDDDGTDDREEDSGEPA